MSRSMPSEPLDSSNSAPTSPEAISPEPQANSAPSRKPAATLSELRKKVSASLLEPRQVEVSDKELKVCIDCYTLLSLSLARSLVK